MFFPSPPSSLSPPVPSPPTDAPHAGQWNVIEAPAALERLRRPPTQPGVILDDMLREARLTPAEAARRIGVSRAQLSHVRTGHRPMPLTLCVKLGALLGTTAEFWATLQLRHDLWHTLQDKALQKSVRAIASLPPPPDGDATRTLP